jgi:uncharacterized protein YyaL (SSP411 family)
LIALGHLANEPRYLAAAERTVRLFAPALARSPDGHSTLLTALEDVEAPPTSVVLAGDPDEARAWQGALERSYRPGVRVFNLAAVDWPPPAMVKGKKPTSGAVAWVCEGTSCLPPIAALPEIESAFRTGR